MLHNGCQVSITKSKETDVVRQEQFLCIFVNIHLRIHSVVYIRPWGIRIRPKLPDTTSAKAKSRPKPHFGPHSAPKPKPNFGRSLHKPEFIKRENRPLNSLDVNLVDSLVLGVFQQKLCHHQKVWDVDRLKCIGLRCWPSKVHSARLLGSVKSGHSKWSIRLTVKKPVVVIMAHGWHAKFYLIWHVYKIGIDCEF